MIFTIRHVEGGVLDTFEAEGYQTYDGNLIVFRDKDRDPIKIYVIRNIVWIDIDNQKEL